MDDISRDVAQRQAHNEYVVPAVSSAAPVRHRFSWQDLDRGIQEQILQDAPPYSRRYFTNPLGGFNWAELERGVRAQILRDTPPHSRRYFTNPRGGFNWTELDAGVRAQIVRHAMTRVRLQTYGEDYLQEFDPSGNWPVPTIQDLSIVGNGGPQAWHALWPAPTLLHVTFSQRLNREELERQWDAAEDAQDRVFYPRFPRLRTGPQLDELESQVQRSYVWTGVHSIRLIRHDGHDHQDPDSDQFTVQFVRRGEHGDEVMQAPRRLAGMYSFRLSRASRDELAMELTTRLGMRHSVIRRLGFRHRTRYWMGGARPGDPPLEHPNGEEWSVPRA
jgi:hypothetical protein